PWFPLLKSSPPPRATPFPYTTLFRSIAASGLLVSEYAPGVEPAPWRFPARNRIVAGLCAATVVVEARERSGALITADLALEEGRDRKSTRLNSSHQIISYAVFCLKKK